MADIQARLAAAHTCNTAALDMTNQPGEARRRRVVVEVEGRGTLPRLLLALAITLSACAAWLPPRHVSAAVAVRTAAWLRVDPRHPHTLFIGGAVSGEPGDICPTEVAPCSIWAMRSDDAGATWQDLTAAIYRLDFEITRSSPLYLSTDGRLYMETTAAGISPDSDHSDILYSIDHGAHWRSMAGEHNMAQQNGAGLGYLTLEPLSPRRLYALQWNPSAVLVGSSNDAGHTWEWRSPPSPLVESFGQLGALSPSLLVADRRRLDTVYANVVGANGTPGATFLRSDDAGRHWTTIRAPAHGPLAGFTIVTDRREGALLVGRPEDGPADRLILSSDEGRTWRATRCPGDLQGTCPAFIVDNAFGAGASYAFVRDGIYRFRGAGPAEGRLALGAHLPFRVGSIVAVGSGSHADDPVFVATGERLYRTVDAGRTWASLSVARLPRGFP